MALESSIDRYFADKQSKTGIDWNSILAAYKRAQPSPAAALGSLPPGIQSAVDAQQKADDGLGFFDHVLHAGESALGAIGNVLDVPRQAVVGGALSQWNTFAAPLLGAALGADASNYQVDINGDGKKDTGLLGSDGLIGQAGLWLDPTDEDSVQGMGKLVPFLRMKDDDSNVATVLKGLGAFVGDTVTDPLTYFGGAAKGVSLADRVLLAGTNVAEVAAREVGQTIAKDTAKEIAIRGLARETPEQLATRAALLVEDGVADSVIKTAGRSSKEIATDLAAKYGEQEVADLAGRELGYGAQAAMRRGRGIGLGSFLRSELGHEVADSLIPKLDSRVLNRLEVSVPFTKLKAEIGTGGAGHFLGMVPGAERGVEALTRVGNAVRAPLSLGRYGGLVKDARMAAFRGAAGEAGQAAIGAEKRLYDIKVLMAHKVEENQRLIRAAQAEWVTTAQEAKRKWSKAGKADEFESAYQRFWTQEGNLADLPVPASGTLEFDAFNTALAHKAMDSTYVTYRDMFARNGGSSRIADEMQAALDNEFSKHGVIEDARRVLTDKGRAYVERLQKSGRSIMPSTSAGGGPRRAFQVLDENGNFERWLDPVEINKTMGFDLFETDPFKVGMVTSERARRAVSNASQRRFLQDAGLTVQLFNTEYAGTQFFRDRAGSKIANLTRRAERATGTADAFEERAARLDEVAAQQSAAGERVVADATVPTARQAERIAADPADERLAQLAAERDALDVRQSELRAERDGVASPVGGRSDDTVASLQERQQVLKEQHSELVTMRKRQEAVYANDLAEQRMAAGTAVKAAEAERKVAQAELVRVRKEHDALVQTANDEYRRVTRDDPSAFAADGATKKEAAAAKKGARSEAKANLDEARAARDEAVSNHNAAVAGAKERKSLAQARSEALKDANAPTAHKAILDRIETQLSEVQDLLSEVGADLGAKQSAVRSVLEDLGLKREEVAGLLKAERGRRVSADRARSVVAGETAVGKRKLATAERNAAELEAKAAATRESASRVRQKALDVKQEAKRLLDNSKDLEKYLEHVATLPPADQEAAYAALSDMFAKIDAEDVSAAEVRLNKELADLATDPDNVRLIERVEDARRSLGAAERRNFDDLTMGMDPAYLNSRIRTSGDYVRVGSITKNGRPVEVASAVRDLYATPVVAAALTRHFKYIAKSEVLPENFRVFAKSLETLWKTSATVGRGPSFVVRNILGGMYNAWLGGATVTDMRDAHRYMDALTAALEEATQRVAKEGIPGDAVGHFLDDVVKEKLSAIKIHGTTMWDLHSEMELRGVMGSYTQMAFDDEEAVRGFIRSGLETRDLSAGLDRAEMGRIQNGYYSAANKVINNPGYRYIANKQESAERFLRSSQYFAGIRQAGPGLTGHHYAELVTKATQFDYTDLSPFEQRVLKHVFPFFVFTRNNVPLQLRSLLQSPGKVNAVLRANYYASQVFGSNTEVGGVANANLPPFLREAAGWAGLNGPNGAPIIGGIGAPLADLNKYLKVPDSFSPGDLLAYPFQTIAGGADEASSQVNPLIKFGVEAATGKNLFSGVDYHDTTASPFMQMLPFMGDKSFDPNTGEYKQSGFAQQQWLNFLPQLGQVQRLVPYGPFDNKQYQDRLLTSWTGAGAGLSGLPVAPLATATEGQVESWTKQNTEEKLNTLRNVAAEAGIDWGEVSRAKSGRSWDTIANMIEAGKFFTPAAENELASTGQLQPSQVATLRAVIERMRATAG